MDEDIAVGAYSRKKQGAHTTVWKNGVELDIKDFNDLTTVDYAGTGFMMIKRRALHKLKDEHPEWERRDGKIWAFFQDDGCDLSEDYFLCHEWRKLGGEIMLDPSIKLGHWGLYRYG